MFLPRLRPVFAFHRQHIPVTTAGVDAGFANHLDPLPQRGLLLSIDRFSFKINGDLDLVGDRVGPNRGSGFKNPIQQRRHRLLRLGSRVNANADDWLVFIVTHTGCRFGDRIGNRRRRRAGMSAIALSAFRIPLRLAKRKT